MLVEVLVFQACTTTLRLADLKGGVLGSLGKKESFKKILDMISDC